MGCEVTYTVAERVEVFGMKEPLVIEPGNLIVVKYPHLIDSIARCQVWVPDRHAVNRSPVKKRVDVRLPTRLLVEMKE
jgi:hypothetical protein